MMFPGDIHQVDKRLVKPKLGEEQSEWLRRIVAVDEARLRGDESFKTELRWWREMVEN